MANQEQLLTIISDPYDGPQEGIDFWVDENGLIQVSDNRIAGLIMRRANTSGVFEQKLVKMGQKGDVLLLGFDTLLDAEPVYSARIGFKGDATAEVKQDANGKFCVYVNGKRQARLFNKLTSAKQTIKKLDKDLQSAAVEPEDLDD